MLQASSRIDTPRLNEKKIQQYLSIHLNQISQFFYIISLIVFVPENISSRSVLPAEQLRGHVSWISLLDIVFHSPLHRVCTLLLELKQQPEVRKLETTRISNKDVGGLQIQMYKTMRVQVLQC